MLRTYNSMKYPHFEEMLNLAEKAMNNAYAPYSHFHVGCCIRTPNNRYFVGSNVENAAFPCSQCAEASAIGSMVSQGEQKIDEMVVIGSGNTFCAPCGNCRQKIAEFANAATIIHMCSKSGSQKTVSLGELLPFMFGQEINDKLMT